MAARYAPMMSVMTTQHHSRIDYTVFPIILVKGLFFKHEPSKWEFWCFALVEFQSGGVGLYAQHRLYVSGERPRRGKRSPPAGPSAGVRGQQSRFGRTGDTQTGEGGNGEKQSAAHQIF